MPTIELNGTAYALEFGIAPMIRKLCKETGYKLTQIYEMFPSRVAADDSSAVWLPARGPRPATNSNRMGSFR